jgi:nuclear transport factor 2 (NTF2) superfamily protein
MKRLLMPFAEQEAEEGLGGRWKRAHSNEEIRVAEAARIKMQQKAVDHTPTADRDKRRRAR